MLPRLWPAVLSLGWILLAIAAAELVMAGAAVLAKDGEATSFLIGAMLSAFAGGGMVLATRGRDFVLGFRDAVIFTVAAWFIVPVFAAVPLLLTPVDLDPVGAFFEMVSAITTTGSTVVTNLDSRPPTFLLWRSTLQWLGGFGIIGLAIVILPFLKIGGMQLFRLESSDRSDKALPRVRSIAAAVGQIYLGLTVLCFVTYLALGMTPFDALNHAMTTVCTGGFSTHDLSFGHFANPALHWAAVVFMISGAIPFVAYLRLAGRGTLRQRLEPQVVPLLVILTVVSVSLAIFLHLAKGYDPARALIEASFNVVSVMTSTGYASTDYMQWGSFAILIFFLLSLIGGASGSTSGGIKIMRFQIIGATMAQQIKRTIYPHVVQPIRFGGRTLGDDYVLSVGVFVFAYVALVVLVSLLLALSGLDFVSAVSGTVQAAGNIGPGLGDIIGPAGNFASLGDFQKLLLAFTMILGRLEILGVLVLFAPSFYR